MEWKEVLMSPVDGILDGVEGGLDVKIVDSHGIQQRHLHLGALAQRLCLNLHRCQLPTISIST
jgi:hypothetical protein